VTRIEPETRHEPKLLFPGLKSFYDFAVPLAWPIVRVAVGWNLLVHGWGKVARGPSVGLFTRFFAAAAAVEMLVITVLYWKAGFSWLNRGYEYTLLWGLVCFAIALRGGGPYSLDRRIGVQL
jgi:uncharacterized membrane protein YphA (DoxX/SURF4 family)